MAHYSSDARMQLQLLMLKAMLDGRYEFHGNTANFTRARFADWLSGEWEE